MKALIVLVTLVTGCFHNWSKTDTALELAFATANSGDWYETRHITADCAESNPIMGSCGEHISPNIYFPLTTVAHVFVAGALSPKYRHIFQGITTGAEINQVWSNSNWGYGLSPVPVNTSSTSSGLITRPNTRPTAP